MDIGYLGLHLKENVLAIKFDVFHYVIDKDIKRTQTKYEHPH